jgi:histidyl-tRNA synthetase
MALQPVKGTHDILPDEQAAWRQVSTSARRLLAVYGYREIVTPMFEATELFERSVGATTDIVEKEMYTFADTKGRRISLRPEGTAGVVRAYLSHGRGRDNPLDKLFYIGPMFRRERPQKGRFRQFHQVGVEAIGDAGATLDVEVIALLMHLLEEVGVRDVELQLNSVGCPACRPAYRETLVAALEPQQAALCEDCRRRLATNPMRVLDCKVPACGAVVSTAPVLVEQLCAACDQHLREVRGGLDTLGIAYQLNPQLVRGLDYYTRTAFEVLAAGLGAQAAVAAGGRYDGLVEELGGRPTPAIGFAVGMERLIDLMAVAAEVPLPRAFIVCLGDPARQRGLRLTAELRRAGLACDMDHTGRSLKAQLRRADRLGARWAVILGDEELARSEAVVRDLTRSEQSNVPLAQLVAVIAEERS